MFFYQLGQAVKSLSKRITEIDRLTRQQELLCAASAALLFAQPDGLCKRHRKSRKGLEASRRPSFDHKTDFLND